MPQIQSHEVTIHVSDGSTMNAYVARPEEKGPHPSLIVFQEAFGVNRHIRDVTERLAREGYVAIAPELYHRTAPGFQAAYTDFQSTLPHAQAMTEEGMAADLRGSCGWLASQPAADTDRIGSIGFCMGGTVSFFAATLLPIKAAVSYYGGGIAPNPSRPGLLHRAGELRAPVLLYWGGKDQHIKPEHRRAVADALTNAKKPFINVEFSEADHGFFCDQRSSYNHAAAQQSWVLTLKFLADNLR